MNALLKKFQKIDSFFFDASKKLKILDYIEPINKADQKKFFLKGEIKDPDFKYEKKDLDFCKWEKKLKSLVIPQDEFGFAKIFQKKKERESLKIEMMKNVGNKERMNVLALAFSGSPDRDLVKKANKFLKTNSPALVKENYSDEDVRKVFKQYFKKFGLADWHIKLTDKYQTTTFGPEKMITICKSRMFDNPERLAVHEIGVHALRAANGFLQPLKIFVYGLSGYLSTEEGLACYSEEKSGFQNINDLRKYAVRVMAVDGLANQGMRFREAFEMVKTYGFSEDEAWEITYRVFRGGGFYKDYLYLKGYYQVKDFIKNNGDIKDLYFGKIGIQHLPLVKKLVKAGILKKTKYLPDFVTTL